MHLFGFFFDSVLPVLEPFLEFAGIFTEKGADFGEADAVAGGDAGEEEGEDGAFVGEKIRVFRDLRAFGGGFREFRD